jgi:hypothetical protein
MSAELIDLQNMLRTEREAHTELQIAHTKLKYECERLNMKYNMLNEEYSKLLDKYEKEIQRKVVNPEKPLRTVDETISDFREMFSIILGRLINIETDIIVLKIKPGEKEYKYI